MLSEIEKLPTDSLKVFLRDSRNIYAAESCPRRSLEALLNLGRHILAEDFGIGVTEYKEIAVALKQQGVPDPDNAELLRVLAGYRNRFVHFYHEVTSKELYEICTNEIGDIQRVKKALLRWVQARSNRIDESL